jgi:hypothetical protein
MVDATVDASAWVLSLDDGTERNHTSSTRPFRASGAQPSRMNLDGGARRCRHRRPLRLRSTSPRRRWPRPVDRNHVAVHRPPARAGPYPPARHRMPALGSDVHRPDRTPCDRVIEGSVAGATWLYAAVGRGDPHPQGSRTYRGLMAGPHELLHAERESFNGRTGRSYYTANERRSLVGTGGRRSGRTVGSPGLNARGRGCSRVSSR